MTIVVNIRLKKTNYLGGKDKVILEHDVFWGG